jgi:glycosyltransferase involved in cell wall biosynthesis
MRIALLTYRGNMFCGGQGVYASNLAHGLHALGHEVHVISGPPLPNLDPEIPLHEIPNGNYFARDGQDILSEGSPFAALLPGNLWELGLTRLGVFPEMTAFGVRLMLRWAKLQQKHAFEVVLDNQSLCWGLLALQATGVPVVATIHHPLHIDRLSDFEIEPSFHRKWKRTLYFPLFMQQRVAPRLARILTVSQASAAEIERFFGISRKEISVVYNGTDTETFRPIPTRKTSDLIFVGRTEDRKKGIPYLLEALAQTPEHVTLKIVDGRIPPRGLVPRTIERLGLHERITIVDRMLEVDELVREYASARVALVPSFFEGFGFPASEAMACGLPVIASDGGALPEVVGTGGQTGRIVPFRDARALARAITELCSKPEEDLEAMGRRARERILSVFSWREAARNTAGVLEEAVRAHRRP